MSQQYTISEEADQKVQEDLNTITAIIKEEMDPVSIILFGGFGKGEGSFETFEGKVKPLNDYDLYVVTKRAVKNSILEKTSMKCSRAIGRGGEEFCENPHEPYDADRFFHVDIRTIKLKKLKKLKPMQRTFELKHSPVIYGKNVTDIIPDVTVPVSDAIRLLFNKLHHLLLGRNNDIRIKTIYIYKAYLDICAALLILENDFANTYSERNRIFQNLDFPGELKRHVNWACEFRLQPSFDLDNLDDRWLKAQRWTLWALKRIIKLHLKCDVDDWRAMAKGMHDQLPYKYFAPYLPMNFFPAQYVLNIYFVQRAKKFKIDLIRPLLDWRDAGLILGIAMMLYHAGKETLCRSYLNKIERERTELKSQLLELYGLYYSQRIV